MKFERLTNSEDVAELVKYHNGWSDFVTLDFETTGLDDWTDKITDIVMTGYTIDEVVCFSSEHLAHLLDLKCRTVWQNFKFDFKMALRGHGIDLRNLPGGIRDTMLLDHLVDENQEHGLDQMVQRRYGDRYKEIFWSKYKNFSDAPEAQQLDYMCKDGYYTHLLYRDLCKDLEEQNIPPEFVSYVHDLAVSLYDTEVNGVNVDLDYVGARGVELKTEIEQILLRMHKTCESQCAEIELRMWETELEKRSTVRGKANVKRPQFNFSSSKQVCTLLYDVLKLPPQFEYNKKTRTRSRTKNDKALAKIAHLHPIVQEMQGLSKREKMYGTFVEGVLSRVRDSVIYPSFHVNGAVTGRISASDPNLQQLPAKGEWVKLRGVFVPSAGHKIIRADYSQLEICVAAHYSEDPLLLKMIHSGESMHDYTAKICGITRDQAKKMNFTLLYGGTEYKVSSDLGCSLDEAKEYIKIVLSTFKGLKRLIDECHHKAKYGLPITNIFGRVRRFPGNYENKWKLARAERQSFNSKMQGTGADLTHTSFVRIAKAMKECHYGRALFPIHDEIVVDCLKDSCHDAAKMVKSTMSGLGNELGLLVPLTVEVSEPTDRWEK